MQQGVEYADELPKLHKEIKRDVSWVAAVRAQADLTISDAVRLTRIVKAGQGCGDPALPFNIDCCYVIHSYLYLFPFIDFVWGSSPVDS